MAIVGTEPRSLLSDKKKNASNQKAAKEVFEFYANNYRPTHEVERIKENMDLHVGRWPQLENFQENGVSTTIDGHSVEIGKIQVLHYPIVNRVTASMVTDLIRMGLSYTIKDNSSKANNLRKEKRLQIINSMLTEKYVKPLQQSITEQVMQSYGVSESTPMDNQVMQQLQELISKQMQEQVPKSIQEAVKSVRTPDEKLSYNLLKTACDELKLKTKFVDGGTYAICSGEEYYRVSIIDKYLHVEAFNPMNCVWSGSEGVDESQKGQYFIHRKNLTPEDILGRYGTLLRKKTVEDLYDLFSPMNGDRTDSDSKKTYLEFSAHELLPLFKANPGLGEIDYRTKEGQMQMWALRSAIHSGYHRGACIVETYCTWRWTREMRLVERMENGKKKKLFFDEHYEQQPGDISCIPFYAEQVWEGVALGEGDNREYVYLQAVPFQYKDLTDLRSPDLPVYGGRYNTVKGNVKGTVPLDLAKPFQYDYNYLRAKMKKEEATELGKILTMTLNAKPESWSWQEWMDVLKEDHILIAANKYDGANPNDIMAFRAVDLSIQDRILSYMKRLSDAEAQIYSAMNKNPATLGDIGQYANEKNINQQVQGAESLTIPFYNRHQEIVESVLNAVLNIAMIAYKEYGYQSEIVLDEFSKAYFEFQEPFKACSFQLYVVNDMEERKKIENIRARALEYMQNGGSFIDVTRIENAGTIDEILEILEASDKKRAEEAQAQRDYELKQKELELKAATEEKDKQREFDRERYRYEGGIKIRSMEIASTQLEKANDVDNNQINDANERLDKQLLVTAEIEQAKLDLKERELNLKAINGK